MLNPCKSVCLPIGIKFDDSTVVYSRFNPVKSEVFNFNEFFINLDVKVFHQDNSVCHSIVKVLIL